MTDHITRKQLSELMDISADRVGCLDREGKLPCKASVLLFIDEFGRPRRTMIYPKKTMIKWIEGGGHRAEFKSRAKKKPVEEPTGILFRHLFAGLYATKAQKDLLTIKKMTARMNKPMTKTVRLRSDWGNK